MLVFDQTDVMINNSGIMAESASINTQNSLEPIYSVGKRGITSISPNGPIKSVFKIDYICDLDYEPIYNSYLRLKDLVNDASFTGEMIEVGGITGFNCYLQSYSVSVEPNNLAKASCSYVSFLPLSGSVHIKSPTGSYNTTDAVANSWTTIITTPEGFLQTPTYGFNFDFNAEFQPLYTFGSTFPKQVNFISADEKMTFVRDTFTHVKFTGEGAYGVIVDSGINDPNVDLYNIAFHCINSSQTDSFDLDFNALRFNISGAKIINTEMSCKVDDYLKSTTTITNSY